MNSKLTCQLIYAKCSSTLYTSIINFGGNLREYELETSFEHAEQADVCLVLGSSLHVTPAADAPKRVAKLDIPIPQWALHRQIRVTMNNRTVSIIGLDLSL